MNTPTTPDNPSDRCGTRSFKPVSTYSDSSQALAATLYLHPASGARVLDVQRDDNENLLSVLFSTPPNDSTGLPHILEHAVLGGSRRYPVKDPFFHMLKMSLATFLNAMTGPDYTIYPCASNVAADFFNLASVYLDAVFHPLLHPTLFRQEGYHFEFDPPDNAPDRLVVKGIVYNEMRGAYSSANEKMQRAIERGLFPETVYRHDAGGDPDRIIELQYEDFLDYHRRHYHPSNALIVHYGDIPPECWMPFLDERLGNFEPRPAVAQPAPQPRWQKPRTSAESYPIGVDEPTHERSYLAISWLAMHNPTPVDQMALETLFSILLGHPGAPLYRALIDSRLGHDLTHTYTHPFGRELTFNVGIKGSEPDRRKAFESCVMTTLQTMSKPGAIDTEMVDTALTRLGYMFQEISDGFPLKLASQVYAAWAAGGDPFAWLNGRQVLEDLRSQIGSKPDYFAGRIQALLLDNPHRLTTVLQPDPGLGIRQEKAVTARLEERRLNLTDPERERICRETAELEAYQQTPPSDEILACLPQLRIRDLPAQPQLVPSTVIRRDGDLTLLRQDIPSNGVNYLALAADLQDFTADDLRLLNAVFSGVALQMGAGGGDYAATARRIAAHTGDLRYSMMMGTSCKNPGKLVLRLALSAKFLDRQAAAALQLLHDLVMAPQYDDGARLCDLLTQLREQHHSQIVENALNFAMPMASRHIGPLQALLHNIEGLSELREVDHHFRLFASEPAELQQRLKTIAGRLATNGNWTAAFTGTDRVCEDFSAAWNAWQPEMKAAAVARSASGVPDIGQAHRPEPPRQGLAAPMDVAFNVMSLPLPHSSDPESNLLEVGLHLLSYDYLLDEIRFKGSAYGAGARYQPQQGVAHLYSYRDPSIARTLRVFQELPAVVKRGRWSQEDIDRGILGVARGSLRPLRPGSATLTALTRYLRAINDEWLTAHYQGLLEATPEKVKETLERHLDNGLKQAGLCIVSSRERLEALADEPDMPRLEIDNILQH